MNHEQPSPNPPGELAPHELESLCRQAASGDQEAVTRLLCHHHPRLLGFTIRKIGIDWQGKLDAEDVLQEAYISVFAGINTFEYRGEDSFYHWATRIIEHRFLDQVRALRRKKRDATREVSAGTLGGDTSRHHSMLDRLMPDLTTASRVMRRQDAVAAMMMCMAKLPDDYRDVVQRVYLDEQPIAEVARELGRTEDAVRRLAGRAVERLAASMGEASRYLSQAS
jgi:RNA polymerase sigma-70 factor, ECF subfamily